MRIELCTWKYDKRGNIVHISNCNDVKRIEFLYDKRDNIIWEMFTNVTRNVGKVEWVISKRYSFDDMRIYCKEGFWEIGLMSWESKFGIYSHS